MSNKTNAPTEPVRFRHQAWITEQAAAAFAAECAAKNWEPGTLLRIIIEERYDVTRQ